MNIKKQSFRFTCLVAITLFFAFCFLFAQTQNSNQTDNSQVTVQPPSLHQWGAVTLFHGLPSDRVRAIAQDEDGVMWFGTDAGLARYDGRRTQAIASNELTQGRINALSFDENKTLWIAAENGAVRFVEGQFKLIKETEGRVITAFLHLDKNKTLAASEDGFLFEFEIKNENSIAVKTVPGKQLQSEDADNPGALAMTSLSKANGKIFVGSRSRGVFELDGEEIKEVKGEPRGYFVEAMKTDGKGHLWVGTRASARGSGLYQSVETTHPKRIGAGIGTVLSLRSDKQNNLWVGTDEQGVFQFHDDEIVNQFTFDGTAGGLRSNRIFEVFVDREDVVWFGTDRGISRYDPRALRVELLSSNPESNFIRTIYRTKDGALYCGTNRGLFVQSQSVWRSISELSQKTIYAIDEDTNGRLLVATASGLYTKDKKGFTQILTEEEKELRRQAEKEREKILSDIHNFTEKQPEELRPKPKSTYYADSNPNDSVRAIAQSQNKTYIATFGRGVELLESENRKIIFPVENDDVKLKEINALFTDTQGRLWIGTSEKGILVFDGNNAINNPSLKELQGVSISSITEMQDGALWFATAKGLYYFKQNILTLVLPNQDVRSVKVHKNVDGKEQNQVWCATADGGVFKISFDENQNTLISTLDSEQGLPSQKTFALLQEKNEQGNNVWWIGTNRGIARYEINYYAPLLRAVRAIGKREYSSVELKEILQLEYPQNSLVLEVAALSSRTFPEQFQFTFKLFDAKGAVVDERTTRESQFSMQGLKPETYRIEVVAYNSDLVPSKPLTVEFSVANAPFPWFTLLLTALLLLAVAALVWAIFEHRRITSTSAALANANLQLADARLQLANEAETERRRIARDLHDQTLADLRRLMLMSDQLKENGNLGNAKINSVVFRSEIENVSNEIRRICEDLSPSVLENVGFAAALEFALSEAVAHLPEENRFDYKFICDDDMEECLNFAQGVTMQIYRIAQEAISNICRHANAQKVTLEVLLKDDEFVLKLEDDGNGFDLNTQTTGRGLANITARASLIDANVNWIRKKDAGMIFVLKRPNSSNDDVEIRQDSQGLQKEKS